MTIDPNPGDSLLLTDLSQLSMLEAYLEGGCTETAAFEFLACLQSCDL